MWHVATIGFTKEDRFGRLICCFQLTGHCRLKVFKIWAFSEDRICEVGYSPWLFFLMILGFQSMSCCSRTLSKIRDGFSPLGNNPCTFVKFLTLGCFCIATVVQSLSCKKGTSLNGQVYFIGFTKGNTINIVLCNSWNCIVPQGLKKLQTEIAAFDKQKTEELDRLEQFREEELRKLRYVSFCPNTY